MAMCAMPVALAPRAVKGAHSRVFHTYQAPHPRDSEHLVHSISNTLKARWRRTLPCYSDYANGDDKLDALIAIARESQDEPLHRASD